MLITGVWWSGVLDEVFTHAGISPSATRLKKIFGLLSGVPEAFQGGRGESRERGILPGSVIVFLC